MNPTLKTSILIACALTLGACATTHQSEALSPAAMNDAVNTLKSRYKPAKTRIQVQPSRDAQSQAFVQKLRDSGYAVVESNKPETGSANLAYIFEPTGNHLYRLSLSVSGTQLSRAYTSSQGIAAGPWLIQESAHG